MSFCQTHYAATSCHPGGVIGAEPVLTSFQIKALPDPWVIGNPNPLNVAVTSVNALKPEDSLAIIAWPVTVNSWFKSK